MKDSAQEGLRELEPLPTEMSSESDDIAQEFYCPCLRRSSLYTRISGYFSSLVYLVAWSAIKEFVVRNDGYMRVICSPQLSRDDARGIEYGYKARNEDDLVRDLRAEIDELLSREKLKRPARLLSALIANEIVEVRLAEVKQSAPPVVKRMFHDKVGVFSDQWDNHVGFRGSLNETFLGLSSDLGHIESIDVFPSWAGGRDGKRVANARRRFGEIWGDELRGEGIKLSKLPPPIQEDLTEIGEEVQLSTALEHIGVDGSNSEESGDESITLRPHQSKALQAWEDNGLRGILEHATGSGKTVTGVFAIRRLLERSSCTVIIVPKSEIQDQWYNEIRSILGVRSIRCGGGHTRWKAERLVRAAATSETAEIIIAVLATARKRAFLKQLEPALDRTLLIADEVHRVGASDSSRILRETEPAYRLGLSATPQRSGDRAGTEKILDFFEGIVHRYTLSDAIDDGYLSPYSYAVRTVFLNQHEQEEWDTRTKRIAQLRAGQEDSPEDSGIEERIQRELQERAKIKKGAAAKAPKAVELIKKKYEQGDRWLVYCDNVAQLNAVISDLEESDIPVREYHSKMKGDRARTLAWFKGRGGVVVSMKCLDEGVDIPKANKGLILASSTNKRQFIQRRGRLLRRGGRHSVARLYDFIVLPADRSSSKRNRSLLAPELARALLFSRDSVSRHTASELEDIWLAYDFPLEELEAISYEGFETDSDTTGEEDN